MTVIPGKIGKSDERVVACAKCMCVQPLFEDDLQLAALRAANDYGWRKIVAVGWVCPECKGQTAMISGNPSPAKWHEVNPLLTFEQIIYEQPVKGIETYVDKRYGAYRTDFIDRETGKFEYSHWRLDGSNRVYNTYTLGEYAAKLARQNPALLLRILEERAK